MAKEQEFIQKLTDFSNSLESLVEILIEQQKNDPTNILNNLMDKFDGGVLSTISENLEEVKKNTIEINKTVDKTLKVVESIKKEKEGGMFAKIEDGENKSKIISGAKSIVLIAGAVLAIGMAFKLIGDVDFMSVVSVGMGIIFIAKAFSIVASTKDADGKPLTWKKALFANALLIMMATSLTIAGLILQVIPRMDIYDFMTIIGIAAATSIASYFLLKAIGGLDPKSLALAPLIPLIIPIVALGIVGAAFILGQMPKIEDEQVKSAFVVSLALVPITLSFALMAFAMKNASIDDIMFVSLAAIPMAVAILGASWILKGTADIDLEKVLSASIGVGLGVLALIPAMWVLGKAGFLTPKGLLDLTIGAGAIVLLSIAISAASWVLSVGKYTNYPSFGWASGVGLSILAFSIPVMALGLIIAGSMGLGLIAIGAGAAAILGLASLIVGVAEIFNLYDWSSTKGPSVEWASGVGMAITAFAVGIKDLSSAGKVLGIFGKGLSKTEIKDFMEMIATSMIKVNDILKVESDWAGYPTKEWAKGVGDSIMSFANAIKVIKSLNGWFSKDMDAAAFNEFMVNIAQGMKRVNMELKGVVWSGHPSVDWAKTVGDSILSFAKVIVALDKAGVDISAKKGDSDSVVSVLTSLAKGLVGIANIFENSKNTAKFDVSKTPNSVWTKNITDSLKGFSEVMKIIDSGNISDVYKIARAMRYYANKINSVDSFNSDIITNIIKSIDNVVKVIPKQTEIDPLWSLVNALKALEDIDWGDMLDMDNVSSSIKDMTKQLNKLDETKINNLSKLGVSLQTLALIDQFKLEETLKVMKDKSDSLSQISDDHSVIGTFFDEMIGNINPTTTTTTPQNMLTVNKDKSTKNMDSDTQLLYHVRNIDTNLETMLQVKKEIAVIENEEELDGKNVEGKTV